MRAHSDVIHLDNLSMVIRTASGSDAVVTALNLDDDPVTVPVADAGTVVVGSVQPSADGLRLPPRGVAVLQR